MTNSPPSSSDSASFERLHPAVRRWIWQQDWQALRDIQEAAVPVLLEGSRDVLIAAATAGGKTEAAFLPIVSAIAGDPAPGFHVLCLSPLKALINDQFRRLESLCELAKVPVFRWHGDVPEGPKREARRHPAGILLITPESLEAQFVRRGADLPRLFAPLRHVVIDELHAFIGAARGIHLLSLLARLETVLGRAVPRVGLSATLGDMALAAECLRPGGGAGVAILESRSDGQELRVQLRGHVAVKPAKGETALKISEAIARHLFQKLRGANHLVFAGSRGTVEAYADRLRLLCEELGVPNEFFPHHGNLSRELREQVEARLRRTSVPTTAIATTTLELGVDLGDVESVAIIGAPASVAATRQRLGRSGRRPGSAAVLRLYVTENALDPRSHPIDALRAGTVQSVAAIRLLVDGWCEPPRPGALDLSTLVHQLLALIVQYGGVRPARAYEILCETGPFRQVGKPRFARLLRCLHGREPPLIEQSPDGLLMLAEAGERITTHYSFYAVFETPEEYRVTHQGRLLGLLQVENAPLAPDTMIILAGRRWVIAAVHPAQKLLEVVPAGGGVPPPFQSRGGAPVHDGLVRAMRLVYAETEIPAFLDATARELLAEGRAAFRQLDLDRTTILDLGERTLLLPWQGTIRCDTLRLAFAIRGFKAESHGFALELAAEPDEVIDALGDMAAGPPPDPLLLASAVRNKTVEKYDACLDAGLLTEGWASSRLDTASVPLTAAALLRGARPAQR